MSLPKLTHPLPLPPLPTCLASQTPKGLSDSVDSNGSSKKLRIFRRPFGSRNYNVLSASLRLVNIGNDTVEPPPPPATTYQLCSDIMLLLCIVNYTPLFVNEVKIFLLFLGLFSKGSVNRDFTPKMYTQYLYPTKFINPWHISRK